MSEQSIFALISGTFAVVVALISKTELFSRKHLSIKKDIELYGLLPDAIKEKNNLLTLIDTRLKYYIQSETELKRSLSDTIVGAFFLVTGLYLSWFYYAKGGWWRLGWIMSVFFLMLAGVGLWQGLVKMKRDEKGRPIKKQKQVKSTPSNLNNEQG